MRGLLPAHSKVAEAVNGKARFAGYQLNQRVLDRLWLERLRQQELLRAGKLTFNCATAAISPDRKLRVLTEELGEIAEAIDQLESVTLGRKEFRGAFEARRKGKLAHLRDELTQLTACGIAWLESLETEPI